MRHGDDTLDVGGVYQRREGGDNGEGNISGVQWKKTQSNIGAILCRASTLAMRSRP